jgi:hypothetical protein
VLLTVMLGDGGRSGSPINYLLIESLQQFHHYYGNDLTLSEVANQLSNRLIKLWLRKDEGERPFLRASVGAFNPQTNSDLYWFYKYFNADTGGGLGALSSNRLDRAGGKANSAARIVWNDQPKGRSTPVRPADL